MGQRRRAIFGDGLLILTNRTKPTGPVLVTQRKTLFAHANDKKLPEINPLSEETLIFSHIRGVSRNGSLRTPLIVQAVSSKFCLVPRPRGMVRVSGNVGKSKQRGPCLRDLYLLGLNMLRGTPQSVGSVLATQHGAVL